MAFKTGKLVVDGDDIDTKNAYKNADDVPGYKHLVEHGYHDCIAYLKQISEFLNYRLLAEENRGYFNEIKKE